LDHVYSDLHVDLTEFKLQLKKYSVFFSGVYQQDAYECFINILEILHKGTKQNLISDSATTDDDTYMVSLSKRLFNFYSKNTFQCQNCRMISSSYSQCHSFFIYPKSDSSLADLLSGSITSSLFKLCTCCQADTTHDLTTSFEQPPEVLVMVVSRFASGLSSGKNYHKIVLDRKLCLSNSSYHLIGSVHHHGSSVTSGHYTSNIFYESSAFTCNDSQIVPLFTINPSNSVYLVFYARSH